MINLTNNVWKLKLDSWSNSVQITEDGLLIKFLINLHQDGKFKFGMISGFSKSSNYKLSLKVSNFYSYCSSGKRVFNLSWAWHKKVVFAENHRPRFGQVNYFFMIKLN